MANDPPQAVDDAPEDVPDAEADGGKGGLLDFIERAGNKVPSPAIMFLYLILGLAALSAVLAALDISITEQVAVPVIDPTALEDLRDALGGTVVPYDVATNQIVEIPDYEIQDQTFEVRSLISIDGLRFVFSTFVSNFAGFSVVAVTLVAMAGVGVAEKAGLMAALIRKIVKVAPSGALAFILIFVGVLSSVASDAGYLILVPLGAAAFLSVGRHPLAGMAAAFAGVASIFAVNVLITPTDSMLTEITNEAIGITGGEPLTITANFYFSAASAVVIALVAAVVSARIVEPRLGVYQPSHATAVTKEGSATPTMSDEPGVDEASEARGLRNALYAFLVCAVLVVVMTAPPGAPLRHAETDAILGATPFMDSLIFVIALIVLIAGIAFGKGAGTIKSKDEVVAAIASTFGGLGGLLLMFLMIAQFIAFFNYTNIPRVLAVEMAQVLERVDISALLLLIGLMLVIVLLDFILPGVVPKWAIFAPVFIPIFTRLDVAPQTVLAAYRVGDSPVNSLTPLMVYLPFIVTIAQRYEKKAGIGTVIALMLPYAVVILVAWIIFFAAWFLLGIPLGPDSPVEL